MFGIVYINVIYWVLAIGTIIAWSRFVLWLSLDVREMPNVPAAMWDALGLASVAAVILVWVMVPLFWLAFPFVLMLAAGLVAWYWVTRVAELGPAGHLFGGAIRTAGAIAENRTLRRNSGNLGLKYLRNDESSLPLPAPEDPMSEGMANADSLLINMIEKRAEIMELTPSHEGYDCRLIIDGVTYAQPAVPRTFAEGIIQVSKQIAGLSLEERRRPQTGVFKTRSPDGTITSITIRTSGTTSGERIAYSSNEKGRWHFGIEQLGFSTDQLAQVKQITSDTSHAVLVAAPKGHGRASTLYAFVRQHDAFLNSVMTLEVNPQDDLESTTVVKFDPRDPNVTFAKAAQSVFLKDPTVSMIAQCPDTPTADAIARFSADERRVYVGISAHDAMQALEIWLKMVSDKTLAIESLRAIVAERLVRLLCPTCKIAFQADDATLKKMNLPVGRNLQSFKANTGPITDDKGNQVTCPDCGGIGYRGRTAIFEVLVITDELRQVILSNGTLQQVRSVARKNNMMLLIEHGFRKFASGLTSLNEIARVMTPEKTAGPAPANPASTKH